MSTLSQLKVFNDYAKGSMTETLQQQVEIFNGACRGAISLVVKANDGDYSDMSYWKRMSGLVRRRDAYGSGAVAEIDLEQLLETSVKVAAGTPPVSIPPSRMKWILKDPKEEGVVYGQQLAPEMMGEMLNTAIAAGRSAMLNIGTEIYTDGKANKLSWVAMNGAVSKFGDRASRIIAWITHSKPVFDLWEGNLTNAQQLFMFGDINVISDPFGRPIVMTDSPALRDANGISAGVASYFSLGLTAGAIAVSDNGDFEQNIDTSNGSENIKRNIQSEWSYNVAVKGCSWDKANGGKSPTTASLATGTNWDRVATDVKNLGGVILETK